MAADEKQAASTLPKRNTPHAFEQTQSSREANLCARRVQACANISASVLQPSFASFLAQILSISS
jgi:hypothetical protein